MMCWKQNLSFKLNQITKLFKTTNILNRGLLWIARTLLNCIKLMNSSVGKCTNGTSSNRSHTAIKCSDYFVYFYFKLIQNLFIYLIIHFMALDNTKIPKVATLAPIIKVLPFFWQKFLPSLIASLVYALISWAAFDRSCLSFMSNYFT